MMPQAIAIITDNYLSLMIKNIKNISILDFNS